MDEKLIIESLSPIERNVLPNLSKDFNDIENIAKASAMEKTPTLRAVGFLKNKNLVEIETSEKDVVILGILGINYFKKELPERTLLNKLMERKAIPIGEIRNTCGLNDNEAKVALGVLKKKALVEIKKGRLEISARPEEVVKKMPEESFLEKLPMEVSEIVDLDKLALANLKSRKDIIQLEKQKSTSVKLTELGVKISKKDSK